MTILGYNVTILFTFFAVNGAGNGDATTFAFIVLKETPQSGTLWNHELVANIPDGCAVSRKSLFRCRVAMRLCQLCLHGLYNN